MTSASIETYSGRWFDILEPTEDMIDIESIAHSLSMICRFTGHVRYFYSVGQHSWLGSYLVPRNNALEFLLHDASEAFIGDMSRPLKHCTNAGQAYREVETRISEVIRKKFALPLVQSEIIHKIDTEMLYAEKNQLMAGLQWGEEAKKDWEAADSKPAPVIIYEMTPREVETQFLERFKQLTGTL